VPGLFWGMGTTMLRMSEPPQASDVDMPGPNPNEEGPVANHAPEVLMGPPATAAR
jgi:hypothetical protein